MTQEELNNVIANTHRADAIKLAAEAEKLQAEANSKSKFNWNVPVAWVTALAAIASTFFGFQIGSLKSREESLKARQETYDTRIELDKKKKEFEVTEKKTKSLQAEANLLDTQLVQSRERLDSLVSTTELTLKNRRGSIKKLEERLAELQQAIASSDSEEAAKKIGEIKGGLAEETELVTSQEDNLSKLQSDAIKSEAVDLVRSLLSESGSQRSKAYDTITSLKLRWRKNPVIVQELLNSVDEHWDDKLMIYHIIVGLRDISSSVTKPQKSSIEKFGEKAVDRYPTLRDDVDSLYKRLK